MKSLLPALTLAAVIGAAVAAGAATLGTGDGLELRLDDRTGAVTALLADGKALPLVPGAAGALSYREFPGIDRSAPKVAVSFTFEEEGEAWVPAAPATTKEGEPIAVARRTDGGAGGSRGYVRLGEKERFGHGLRLKEPIPVEPGEDYEVSWQARVPAVSATYILYVRVLDFNGREVTEQTTPPVGWTWSPYSRTHYLTEIAASAPGAWERLSRTYRVPEGAARLDAALCLWRGDYADADSLQVTRTARVRWGAWTPALGRVTALPDGKGWRQSATSPDGTLRFEVDCAAGPGHLRADVRVGDARRPLGTRAMRVRYTLPVRVAGWTWEDDVLTARRVEPGRAYANAFHAAGHPVSRYPFTALHDEQVGLSLAAPMDVPRLQSFTADAGGYHTEVDLGLSPATEKLGPGQASFSLLLYRHDPAWGFRSAAERYYRIFPEAFANRTGRFGGWGWPIAPSAIPRVDDFGVAFLECGPLSDAEYRFCREKGILTFHYIEPRGVRQTHRGVREREKVPSWEQALAEVEAWAADRESAEKWMRAPRSTAARSVLNSLAHDADGRPAHVVDYWDVYSHWWITNPDPDLPAPNRSSLALDYEAGAYLEKVDGIYVDSVSLLNRENHRAEHFAAADLPLAFSTDTAEPVLAADLSMTEFLMGLAERLRAQGKYVMLNVFAPAHRFCAHLGDVSGCEIADLQADGDAMLQRVYAGRRPVTNLMQYRWSVFKRVPEMSREQVGAYLEQQMFYGFFPGFSTIGGGSDPGYAGMKRYFRSPEQYERDRDLFRRVLPVTRRLSEAGWEPVTHARAETPDVRIERFGRWEAQNIHFTVRNAGKEKRNALLRVAIGPMGVSKARAPQLAAVDLLSGRSLAVTSGDESAVIECPLGPGETVAVAIR